jgi:putative flippase GtrA
MVPGGDGGDVSAAAQLVDRVGSAARESDNWLQLLKFGVVGCSGYAINLIVFEQLSGRFGIHHSLAAIGSFCVAVCSNFVWNRYWTFGPGTTSPAFQALRFFTVSSLCLLINLAVLEAILVGTDLGQLSAQAIAVAVVMPVNFLANRAWTFA